MYTCYIEIRDYEHKVVETREVVFDDYAEMSKQMNYLWQENGWRSYAYPKGREFMEEPIKRKGEWNV